MMPASGDTWQFSFVKSVRAFLHDQTNFQGRKHHCLLCFSRFTKKEILRRHEEVCKGIKSRPMRTVMPKESENLVSYRKVGNQLKAPYVIYADLELIVEKRQSCEGDPQKSYKVKTGRHSAYGQGRKK